MAENPARIQERQRVLELLRGVLPGRHKYRARAKEYNGIRYDSTAEATRAHQLDQLLAAGGILEWIRQPTVRLGVPENVYRPDFLVIPNPVVFPDTPPWFEDVKGVETRKFKRDKVLWRAYGRLKLLIYRGGRCVETIVPDKERP